MRELGGLGHELKPCWRALRGAGKMVRDLPAKDLAIRQSPDRTRKCFRRQLAQPQGQVGEFGRPRRGEEEAVDPRR